MLRRVVLRALLALGMLASGCGGGGGSAPATGTAPPPGNPAVADISVLMFGNSHTVTHGLPDMLAAMLRAGRPGKTVAVVAADGFLTLEERMQHAASRAQLDSQKWSALVLQNQAYSSSGLYEYSITDAVEWVRLARLKGSLPVMFPEWPRRGIDETNRIFSAHVRIATLQPACVAPIPQAFDLSAARAPALALHAEDGNHSSPTGAFLAALVLYSTLTGESPRGLPTFAQYPLTAEMQATLRTVADEQITLLSPWRYCPGAARL